MFDKPNLSINSPTSEAAAALAWRGSIMSLFLWLLLLIWTLERLRSSASSSPSSSMSELSFISSASASSSSMSSGESSFSVSTDPELLARSSGVRCSLMWRRNFDACTQVKSQLVHLYWSSPVCVRRWTMRLLWNLKRLSQNSHAW